MKKDKLTFEKLQQKCKERLPLAFPICQEWKSAEWVMAIVGELGEMANILKKVNRGSKKMSKAVKLSIEREFADTVIYLAFLANYLDIDAGEATKEKFNLVSRKFKCKVLI